MMCNLGRQSAKVHGFGSFLAYVLLICRIDSAVEPPRHWFCIIVPLAEKLNFHNHGAGFAYHYRYKSARAKSLVLDNAIRNGSCA